VDRAQLPAEEKPKDSSRLRPPSPWWPERFEAIWFDKPLRLTHLEFRAVANCLDAKRHGSDRGPIADFLREGLGGLTNRTTTIETIRVMCANRAPKLEA